MGHPFKDKDDFDRFLRLQVTRLQHKWRPSENKIATVRRQHAADCDLEWHARGRIAGLSGMVHRAKD